MKRSDKIENEPQFPSVAPDVIFQNVSYSVKETNNIFSRKKKTILHHVSGEFRSGELTAIVGPSGSGKTTLLHILAGFKKNGFTGSVLINDVDRFDSSEKCCYIMQEDCLHPLLKVEEIMNICANLKLGDGYSSKAKSLRVNKILSAIGLDTVSNTLTGNLSNGQRKRLGIALELIDNPPIMFFDEPTSGLDSVTTKQCVSMLQKLAKQNRAVICTLHQPSASVLEMFDHLYCVSNGKCCYSGDPGSVTEFLKVVGLECPPYHNPADFLLEVVGGEFGDYNNILVSSIENGTVHTWRKIMPEWANPEDDSSGDTLATKTPLISTLPKTLSRTSLGLHSDFNTSFISQLSTLLKRCFLCTYRDKFHMYSRLVMHLIVGCLMGIFFFDMGNDAGKVMNIFSLLFFSSIFLAFSALQSTVISFPLEVSIIKKEYFNRWYSVGAYFLANTVADLPIQAGCAIFYCTCVYWLSGQPREFMRYAMFTFICITVSLLAQSIGYFVGSSVRVIYGVVLGPFMIMPWIMMCGYFIREKDAPGWAKPFFTMSFLRHGMEGLAASLYGYSRPNLPCVSQDFCLLIYPKRILKELDIIDANYVNSVLVLLGLNLFVKAITYFSLVYQLKFRR